jgi:uncharacterized membrane protein
MGDDVAEGWLTAWMTTPWPLTATISAGDSACDRGETEMSGSDSTFVLVATYQDEELARDDYQVVKDAHKAGLVGSYDAAVITKDAAGKIHENKDETATRHGAWWGIAAGAAVGVLFPPAVLGAAAVGGVIGGVSGHLAKGMSRSDAKELGDYIGPGEAGLVVVGESKVEEAISKAVTRAVKQTARDLDVDPKNIDRTLQEAVREM